MTFDQLIQSHIDQAIEPLQKTISELRAKIDEYEKEKPFLIDKKQVVRRKIAAKIAQMNASTLDERARDFEQLQMDRFKSTKLGRMTYYYVDSLDLTSEQVRKLNEFLSKSNHRKS